MFSSLAKMLPPWPIESPPRPNTKHIKMTSPGDTSPMSQHRQPVSDAEFDRAIKAKQKREQEASQPVMPTPTRGENDVPISEERKNYQLNLMGHRRPQN